MPQASRRLAEARGTLDIPSNVVMSSSRNFAIETLKSFFGVQSVYGNTVMAKMHFVPWVTIGLFYDLATSRC